MPFIHTISNSVLHEDTMMNFFVIMELDCCQSIQTSAVSKLSEIVVIYPRGPQMPNKPCKRTPRLFI